MSPNEVEVDGETNLKAENFAIATGRRAGIPPIQGIDGVPYYTNETIFDNLNQKPDRLVIVGAGPIGCELGQVFNRLGVEVTLFEFMPQIMGKEDPDIASFVQKRLETEGVRVLTSTGVNSAQKSDGRINLMATQRDENSGETAITLETDALLIAAGRIPNVEGLDLEAAGVDYERVRDSG